MKNRWSNRDAEAMVRRSRRQGIPAELARRIYTSHLLGGETGLVVHGGGNTSVKLRQKNCEGRSTGVLFIKGSGWDLADIEAAGFPAVELERLIGLRKLATLSDAEMVNALRTALLNAQAPTPSVEALLHAFLPQKFVDHSHANAILSITNQRDGEKRCRDIFREQAAIVPYVMSGFELAKASAAAYEAHPSARGLIVPMHGIFTYGETARESYTRMIELVSLAERAIAGGPKKFFEMVRCLIE